MLYGIVKHWDFSKGFGFITCDDDGEDYFVHAGDLGANLQPKMMREGLRVKFDTKSDFKGEKAINVRQG